MFSSRKLPSLGVSNVNDIGNCMMLVEIFVFGFLMPTSLKFELLFLVPATSVSFTEKQDTCPGSLTVSFRGRIGEEDPSILGLHLCFYMRSSSLSGFFFFSIL
jgi:hypothetical protein